MSRWFTYLTIERPVVLTRSRRVTAALIAKYVNRASSLFTGAHAYPAEKILDRRQLLFLANHNSPEQTLQTRLNLNEVEQDVDDD